MKMLNEIVVLFLLASHFMPAESVQCTDALVTLSNELKLQNGAFTLPAKVQPVTITIKQATTCTITVNGYKEMKINMTFLKYALKDGGEQCTTDYFKAGKKSTALDFQVCKTDAKSESITSESSSLYLEIKSSENSGSVELNFQSIQGDECGSPIINLKVQNETIKFPMNEKSFTDKSDCDVQVKGILGRPFKMYITNIKLSNDNCDKNYLAASVSPITGNPPSKMCKQQDVQGPIDATKGELYLKILTQSPMQNAEMTLQFISAYPECGASEVEVPETGLNITLPPMGEKFKTDTVCNMKFSNKDGKNFKMTIPQIKFANGNCNEDYVSASSTQGNLPDDKYKKCGSAPVTDPLESANGALYVQIKTKSPMEDSMVQLQFVSGSATNGKYVFVSVIIFKLLSIIVS